MGWQVTILHRLRDRDPADDGVCPIGGAWGRSLCTLTRWVGPGRLYAHVNPMGGAQYGSMRTLTRWVAVWALCPGSHLDASASIPAVCEHCTTSHLVQYIYQWCSAT